MTQNRSNIGVSIGIITTLSNAFGVDENPGRTIIGEDGLMVDNQEKLLKMSTVFVNSLKIATGKHITDKLDESDFVKCTFRENLSVEVVSALNKFGHVMFLKVKKHHFTKPVECRNNFNRKIFTISTFNESLSSNCSVIRFPVARNLTTPT
jgi:hypothetical protein